jgi:hypothetical protein
MSAPQKLHGPSETRKVSAWLRLKNVRDCIAVGMLDLAYDQLKGIDPSESNEPSLESVTIELERARRAMARNCNGD